MDTKRWLRRLKYAAELKEKRVRLARLHQPTADVRCPTQGADASTIAFLGSEAHGKSVKPMAKGKSKGGKAGGSEASGDAGAAADKKLKPANSVKVRHILCEKQSKILEAQQRIAAGEQFATVATQMSEDKARQGGDLGWKRRQEVVGAFADAAFKLEAGQMTSQPIKTQFGYHLILCEGRKQ